MSRKCSGCPIGGLRVSLRGKQGGMPMQADDAEALRGAWRQNGSPPCPHDEREKEYYLDSDTQAEICLVCGRSFWRGRY